ncbi:MAG: hypothetical protein ABR591_07215 [Candidatus Velthaea sp.]
MIVSVVVTIVVNGAIVPSFAPARIVEGRVVGPVAPVVARLASRAAYFPADGTVLIERASRRILVPVSFIADDAPYVPLARVVRALGGTAVFDARTKTLSIVLTDDGEVATPAPFDPHAPQVTPTSLFTPEPPRPTPRVIETGRPVPRRTAIPAIPSQPQPQLTP